MNKLQLLRILRRHIKLGIKRSVAYEQNKVSKFLIYLFGGFALIYLIGIAILISLAANSSTSSTPDEFLFGLMPFFLVADFFIRFIGQNTPTQLIKPYSLLPISKYTCIELFIVSSAISSNNLIWTAISAPYSLMSVVFSEGFFAALGIIVSFQIIITINSQWYMLVRTLINNSLKWWLLPILVYALIFSPIFIYDFDRFFDFYSSVGPGFAGWNPLYYLGIILELAVFMRINRQVQFHFTYLENANAEAGKLKSVYEFKMFDRYGEIGQYLKLEIKSLIRNKNLRKSFLFGTIFTCLISLGISLTDVYDDPFYKIFWIVYIFVMYGSITLIKIMSAEGNYIDCLIIHKENIVQLLKAKYYFYSSMLVLPLLLMLPTVFAGKNTLLSLFSMMFFTAGPIYCLLMQMAVYNKQTLPLNTKFISKGNVENNYFQIVAQIVALAFPGIFIIFLRGLFNENIAYLILLVTGLIFIILNDIWIRNIYKRFMARRYVNMESFRATR